MSHVKKDNGIIKIFSDVGEMLGFEDNSQERRMRCLWCNTVVLWKLEDRTLGQEELHGAMRRGWLHSFCLGGAGDSMSP